MVSYIDNYNFEVKIGLFNLNFSKITSISASAEYETIGKGGENDTMYFLNKPKRSPDNIVFERGMKQGRNDGFHSIVAEGVILNNIMIIVRKQKKIQRIFWIEHSIVTKKSFGELNAISGALLIRTLELAHTGMIEVAV